jgi:predicted DNA-binding transcriptional regulator AlpA
MDTTDVTTADQRTVVFHRRGAPRTAARLGLPLDEAAAMIGVSYNTLWRAVRDGQFPGVKIRDRIVIPLKAIDMLFEAATSTGELVDAAEWTAHWTASPMPGEAAA